MNGVKASRGISSNRYDKTKTDVGLHIIGLSAELAFARLTGLEPNFEITLHGDAGYDFTTANGLTIEVKYRTRRGNDFALVADELSGLTADIGVLMWPGDHEHEYEFVGWTTRVHAAQVGKVKRLIADRYLIRWQDLLAPEKFMELIKGQ